MRFICNKMKLFQINQKIALLISFITFIMVALTVHVDSVSLTVWSCNIWDNLVETGNPLLFYEYTAQNIYNLGHSMMGCDILVILPWAVWNIPIWLLQRFAGLTIVEHPILLFYSKCFLILVLIGCARTMWQIGKKYKKDEAHILICIALFLSGFYVLDSVAYTGQNDILIVYLMLQAIFALITGKWAKFLVFSAVSIAFEPYYIFSYVAIVLLKEKRIHCIVLYCISGISIYFLQKIPFLNAPMYWESMTGGPTGAIVDKMMQNMLPITPYQVSLFVLALLITYIFSYFSEDKEPEMVLYYSMLPLICFFLFVSQEHYRPLYLFALVYPIMMLKPQYLRINILLETIISGGMIIFSFINSNGDFFDPRRFLLPFSNTNEMKLLSDDMQWKLMSYNHVLMAIIVCSVAMMVVINHPKFKRENEVLCLKTEPYLWICRSVIITIPMLVVLIARYLL